MRSKNVKFTVDSEAEEAVSELFDDNSDDSLFDFTLIEQPAIGRFITAVAALGGMVTIYGLRDSNGIVIASRIGERRQSWQFDQPSEVNSMLPLIADKYYAALGKYLAGKKASRNNGKVPDHDKHKP